MDFWHLFSPTQTTIQIGTGWGSLITLLVTKRFKWPFLLSLFMIGQISAYYFTMPVAQWLGWGMTLFGLIGFLIGALAMFVWGAIISIVEKLQNDPFGTIARLWRLWKGTEKP